MVADMISVSLAMARYCPFIIATLGQSKTNLQRNFLGGLVVSRIVGRSV